MRDPCFQIGTNIIEKMSLISVAMTQIRRFLSRMGSCNEIYLLKLQREQIADAITLSFEFEETNVIASLKQEFQEILNYFLE